MEEKVEQRRRTRATTTRALIDITNTTTAASSQSSTSSSFLIKPLPSSLQTLTKPESNISHLTNAPQPTRNHPNSTVKVPNPKSSFASASTTSRLQKPASLPAYAGFSDNEVLERAVVTRRQTTNKRSGKDKNHIDSGSTHIDQSVTSNPVSSASVSVLPTNALTPSQPSRQKSVSITAPAPGTVDGGVSPHSVYTRRKTSDRNCRGKAIAAAETLSVSPARRIPTSRSKINDDGDISLPKYCAVPSKKKGDCSRDDIKVDRDINLSKSCVLPRKKKKRHIPSAQDDLQDFVKQQRAYFKEVDEFELPVEEVASGDELE